MTLRMCVILASTAIAGLASVAPPALGQSAGVEAVSASSGHRLLSDGLFGAAARATFPLGGASRWLRLGVEHLSGEARRTGSPCSGLIEPGTCQPEPLRDDARLTSLTGGLGVPLLVRSRLVVEVTGDLRLGWARADTKGLESDRRLSANKTVWGGEAGIDAAWSPSARLPLALQIGAAIGGLKGVIPEDVVDGYTPFNEAFSVTRLRVGLAWRRSAR
jgi:hypothetical protein